MPSRTLFDVGAAVSVAIALVLWVLSPLPPAPEPPPQQPPLEEPRR